MFTEVKSALQKPTRKYTYREVDESEVVSALEDIFVIRPQTLRNICKHFVDELTLGLKEDGHTLKMIPSYVTRRPTGKETGSYLALDLGGTNFRVCEVYLEGDSKVRLTQKKFTIPDYAKCGQSDVLFDFLADSVLTFITENNIPTESDIPLGFTFSFPVDQTAIDKGYLMVWTKGFDCKDTINKDVVALLNEALARKNVKVHVTALVNDTVGTLMSHAYYDPGTFVGVILGTGTNAAYVEKVSAIPKWKGGPVESGEMIINCEWGAFDNERVVLPFNKYDQKMDEESTNPGQQTFEKMISGMYLGEIVRQVIVELIQRRILFGGISSPEIETPYKFETAYMSRIERDHTSDLLDTKMVLQELLNIPYPAPRDRRIVRRICELVATRAARLSAVGVAAVVTKMERVNDGCTVAIDGSVYEHYPHFGNRMKDALHELLGMFEENVNIVLGKDGSSVGAGVIAALA
uniref:Phosphotransferase n=1 Tax=Neocallimastix frontalis TaxID=4757 RepID=K9LGW4_NEOFR|nr:hexokinase 3 [Neocallimastix frontalis]